jgi:nucleoside-diphosphate-sugar epimerase
MQQGLKVIITGATGMVGEGILLVCLENQAISNVLIISRKPLGITHPKLKEIIHEDFHDLSPVAEHLAGYDACFFCLGVSSVGMKMDKYRKVTYDLTMHFGETVSRLNSDMVFVYVSGAGTDGTEKGKTEWARIKGKTENDLRKLPFKRVYGYRPGFIKPYKGQKKTHAFYTYINWFFRVGKKLSPDYFNTMEELGLSMIRLVRHDYPKDTLYGRDITLLAQEQTT